MLEIEVCKVRGYCPVHKVGDRILIDDPEIILKKTDALCTHALSSLLHYVLALEKGADPVELGLSKADDRENANIQCLDPGKPYTQGGTVIFKVKRTKYKNPHKKDRSKGRPNIVSAGED